MLVLAIDTCEVRGSVAVLHDEEVLVPVLHSGDEEYSSWLLPAVEKALSQASKSIGEVDLYAVTTGPGSFTGVRVGLTTVKAWSEVFGKPIAAVSRLGVLAREAVNDTLFVAAAISAQREQIFAALYKRAGSELQLVGEEMVIAPGEFINRASEQAGGERVAWASTDAAMIEEQEAWRGRLSRGEEIHNIPCVLAPLVGKLGFRKAREGQVVDALGLDANYVRRSYVEGSQKGPQIAPNVDGRRSKAMVLTRNFTAGDLEALMAVCRRSPEAAQWTAESYETGSSGDQTILVAEVEGQVQGFLIVRFVSGEAEILNIAVDPAKRRDGIGRQLLTATFAEALAKKTDRIYLEVRESNQTAIGFYNAQGFARAGTRRNCYSGPTENAVLMERKLTAQD